MDPLSHENPGTTSDGEAPPVKRPDGNTCKNHPTVAAVFSCYQCSAPICETCAFREKSGIILCRALCPECKAKEVGPLRLVPSSAPERPPPIRRALFPADAFCVQHPHVPAARQCKLCERYMCATCDFSLDGGIHICPACAAAPRPALGVKGRKFLIGSYAAAIWSTLGLACLVSGAFAGMRDTSTAILGYVLLIFVLGPAIAGVSLASSAKRPRRANPASLWIALVWNSIIVGCFLLLTIIGVMRK